MTNLNLGIPLCLVPLFFLSNCALTPATPRTVSPAISPPSLPLNLDAETQALIAQAGRVAFIIPFSHWDTDWHQTFPDYVKLSDQNILTAIQIAKQHRRFRYTLEQTLFVQHFWDTYPEHRADLKALVQNGQLSFAWAGMTQPETSLTAPAVQLRNLQLGQAWIAATFGPASVPHTAWQSDAFGNSAALPIFLTQTGIPYLYIGRWQARCDPDYEDCTPLPHAFYWTSPVNGSAGRVLVTYLSYPTAWAAIRRLSNPDEQIKALRKVADAEFKRTDSKYISLPLGFDFFNPRPDLPDLVERWNATDKSTIIVMADPATAFQYLATQPLPEISIDLNPIWQAFYGTHPPAKIADKESEYFLTAADKFGLLLPVPRPKLTPPGWFTATVNAHYDNIGAVGYDSVWESTQRPRFEQTVAAAGSGLAATLAQLAGGILDNRASAPLVVFNPTSWPRTEIVELAGQDLPDQSRLPQPVQRLGPNALAIRVTSVPPVGWTIPTQTALPLLHPVRVSKSNTLVTLTNGLVTATLDAAHGGAFSSLARVDGPELLTTFGDDVTYLADTGDIYGATFGRERARESQTPARVTILADGPLLARAQVAFVLGDQPLTKTVTLRADSSLIEVTLEIKALPDTTALAQTPTILSTGTRTDDLGFAAFEHTVDSRPIVPGDRTYRREIFYPIIGWSDVSTPEAGLTLITHGLQGINGTNTLNLILTRQVFDKDGEGVTDPVYHTLRYAYLPHTGAAADHQPWFSAYAFNQPLIPAWRSSPAESPHLHVQLPFVDLSAPRQFEIDATAQPLPESFSLISAQSGLIADLYHDRDDQIKALILDYDPATPATIGIGGSTKQIPATGTSFIVLPVELNSPYVR